MREASTKGRVLNRRPGGSSRTRASARPSAPLQQLDPVKNRHPGGGSQVQEAPDVGRGDHIRLSFLESVDLTGEQLPRELGLGERVGSGRAAAQVAVPHRDQLEAARGQNAFDDAVEAKPVLQGAWGMESDAWQGATLGGLALERGRLACNDFADVTHQGAD